MKISEFPWRSTNIYYFSTTTIIDIREFKWIISNSILNSCRFFSENYSTTVSSTQGNRSDGNNGGQVLFTIVLDFITISDITFGLGLWCLTPLSTIFQLCRGDQFCWWRKPEDPEKITDLTKSLTNFITQCCIEYILPRAGVKLTTLVVIDTDCTGSCKSNYHTFTTTLT